MVSIMFKNRSVSVVYLVLIFFALSVLVPTSGFTFNLFSSHKSVKAIDGEVRITIDKVSDGKAHYFTYKADDKTVSFFVVKSSDGVIRAAFDACDVCFHAKKGYRQEGDFMICNNCGMKFHSTRVNDVEGGCNPAPLKRAKVGDQLVIKVSDILPGGRFF